MGETPALLPTCHQDETDPQVVTWLERPLHPGEFVMPAKAGIQGVERALATLDTGFRRYDDSEWFRVSLGFLCRPGALLTLVPQVDVLGVAIGARALLQVELLLHLGQQVAQFLVAV